MRDILYPKQFKFTFYTDSLKFVGIMAGLALIGSFYTTPSLIEDKTDDETIIDRFLNLFVIAVPPALPAAVGCGVAFAARRLRQLKIFCISTLALTLRGA